MCLLFKFPTLMLYCLLFKKVSDWTGATYQDRRFLSKNYLCNQFCVLF